MTKKGLVVPHHLSERQLQDIRELASICDTADGIELKLNWGMLEKRHGGEPHDFLWYEDGRLVGFMALYQFNPKEAEVGGMVHPDYRRRRIFSALMEQTIASAVRQHIPKLLFVCPHHSQAAQAFLQAKGTRFSFSEFGMRLVSQPEDWESATAGLPAVTLRQGAPEDRKLMIRLDSQGFEMSEDDGIALVDMILSSPTEEWPYIVFNHEQAAVGRINIHVRDGNAHFFGFSVLPEHRRQGYGRRILIEAIRLAASQGFHSMTLEVACENRKALELYQSCGFRETYVNDYYSLKLHD